jgi:hypothetical protein
MKKKKITLMVAASIVVAIATLNVRLSVQKTNTHVSLFNIEALTEELPRELTAMEMDILLYGSLVSMGLRSYSNPFHAIKYSSHISVYYLVSMSDITITI